MRRKICEAGNFSKGSVWLLLYCDAFNKKISPFLSFKYSGSIKTTPSARANNTLLLKSLTYSCLFVK